MLSSSSSNSSCLLAALISATEGRAAALVADVEVLFALVDVSAIVLVTVEAQVVLVDAVEVEDVVDAFVLFPVILVPSLSSRPFTIMAILGLVFRKLMRSKLG